MVKEKKVGSVKNFLFLGAVVLIVVLMMIIAVQTTNQKNAINSRASGNIGGACRENCEKIRGGDFGSNSSEKWTGTQARINACKKRCPSLDKHDSRTTLECMSKNCMGLTGKERLVCNNNCSR